jgi:SAM-dependent methyltransferase
VIPHQGYNPATAEIYNMMWGKYAEGFAVASLAYLSDVALPNGRALDAGCGTGQLAQRLAQGGYRVVGIDASAGMLRQASHNCHKEMIEGRAGFVQADIRSFHFSGGFFGVVTSCYNVLNHLNSMDEVGAFFQCVARVLASRGVFVFDLNTAVGLQEWDRVKVTDREECLIVSRGVYDRKHSRAWKKFDGFFRAESGEFLRFEELIYNVAFPVVDVLRTLRLIGFCEIRVYSFSNTFSVVDDPERHDRIVVIACRE